MTIAISPQQLRRMGIILILAGGFIAVGQISASDQSPEQSKNIKKVFGIETSIGAGLGGDLFSAEPDMDSTNYRVANIGISVRLTSWFALGAWFGYWYGNPYIQAGAANVGMWLLSIPFDFGGKLIFGNPATIAVSLNIGTVPSVGVYVFDFFLNLFIAGVVVKTEWLPPDWKPKDTVFVSPYVEIGYRLSW